MESCYLVICDLYPFRDLVIPFRFVSNLHPSRRNLVTWPFLAFVTYTLLGILSFLLDSSITYIRLGKSCYLAIFGFCDLHPFRDLAIPFGFVSNLHPSRRNLVTWSFLAFVTYTLLGILSFLLDSSVIYIRLGGILLLDHFWLL